MFLVVWKPISPDAFHTKFTPSYERTDVKQTITCASENPLSLMSVYTKTNPTIGTRLTTYHNAGQFYYTFFVFLLLSTFFIDYKKTELTYHKTGQ